MPDVPSDLRPDASHGSPRETVDVLVVGGGPAEFYADADEGLREYPSVRRLEGVVNDLVKEADDRFVARITPTTAGGHGDNGDHDHDDNHNNDDDQRNGSIGATVSVTARRIILATGVRDRLPAVEGIDEHYGVDVHHCPACDGLTTALEGVRLADGTVIAGSKVFFSYAHHPAAELATSLGCEVDHEGGLTVNVMQLTSVSGVYAAGDIVTGLQLVPIAVGTGAAAGVACATSLRGHATDEGSPDPAPPTRNFTRPEN